MAQSTAAPRAGGAYGARGSRGADQRGSGADVLFATHVDSDVP